VSGADLAGAAANLTGCPWRLHGRDPATGLDCVGLLAAALDRIGRSISLPTGYPLRLRALDGWMPDPAALGFLSVTGTSQPGDVVLLQPGPAQIHLAIAAEGGGWIHAHAGLRRVVHQSELPPGPVLGQWRLNPSTKV
jgi:cell wall-associated NlpC family hydrolase